MLRVWRSATPIMTRRSNSNVKFLLLPLLVVLAGCGGANPRPGGDPSHQSPPTTSSGPTNTPTGSVASTSTLPSNPCQLLSPSLAKSLYADVASSGEHNGGTIPECKYSSASPAPYVDQVTLELGLVSTPEVETPQQTAEKAVADSTENGDLATHFEHLTGPGEESVYVHAEAQGGGGEQSITWRTNGVQASVGMSRLGGSANGAESRGVLEGVAADINRALSARHP
jgi:hypothetical protein